MTFQQFLEKWNGKYCEVAGSANAKNQCVDLANAYIKDVLELPIIEWTNACDFPKKWKHEWVLNNEIEDLPLEGDLIIWSCNVASGAGHISVFVEGNTSSFKSFDQNWPRYSPCHIQGHTYSNVVGWMRYNKLLPDNTTMTKDETNALKIIKGFKEDAGHGNLEGAANAAVGAVKDLDDIRKLLKTTKGLLETSESLAKTLSGKLATETENGLSLAKRLSTANKKIVQLNVELETEVGLKNQYRRWWEKRKKYDIREVTVGSLFKELLLKLGLWPRKK